MGISFKVKATRLCLYRWGVALYLLIKGVTLLHNCGCGAKGISMKSDVYTIRKIINQYLTVSYRHNSGKAKGKSIEEHAG